MTYLLVDLSFMCISCAAYVNVSTLHMLMVRHM